MAKKPSNLKRVIATLQKRRKLFILPDKLMCTPKEDVLIYIEGRKFYGRNTKTQESITNTF